MKKLVLLLPLLSLFFSCSSREEKFVSQIAEKNVCYEADSLLSVLSQLTLEEERRFDSIITNTIPSNVDIGNIIYYTPDSMRLACFESAKERIKYLWGYVGDVGKSLNFEPSFSGKDVFNLINTIIAQMESLFYDDEKELIFSEGRLADIEWDMADIETSDKIQSERLKKQLIKENSEKCKVIVDKCALFQSRLKEYDSLYIKK